jgi:hypothetical protein
MSERKGHLIEEIKSLPEALDTLEAFVKTLKARMSKRSSRTPAKLGGLWESYGPVTAEEISQWRKEMWGSFAGRDR